MLEAQTLAFRDSIFGSSLPPEIIDAVNGTLGILRSATLIRLEGGEVWGWEGQHHPRRLLRGELYPRLELSAGAR